MIDRRRFIFGGMACGVAIYSPSIRAAEIPDLIQRKSFEWNGSTVFIGPLKNFYRRRRTRGIWTDPNGLTPKGRELIKMLKKADAEGLSPERYVSALPKNLNKFEKKELAMLEMYLSQSLWRYGYDVSAGRSVNKHEQRDIVIPRKRPEIENWLKLAERRGAESLMRSLRPTHPQYNALKQLLKKAKGSRAAQIKANLERWRWLPRDLGDRYLLVNNAGFEMHLVENGKLQDRRKVIVGQPRHRTPMFSHEMRYAEFNPTWTVPNSIAVSKMLPSLRADRNYLKRNKYKLYAGWEDDAEEIDSTKVKWHQVSSSNFPYRIVQQPGEKNALGDVKFMFPNSFNVYLHDTNAKRLFKNKNRALSHGCIRVYKPLEFAQKLFGRSLNPAKVKKLLASDQPERVNLSRPMPIHLAYFTVWMENGKPKYFADVYGHDRLVSRILSSS